MATSNTDLGTSTNRSEESSLTRYDLVLLLIPAAFALALVVSHLFAVPLPAAMATASVIGVLGVADGLFVNPPIRS